VKPLRVLDLFSGMGGLSYGFKGDDYDVTGVDTFSYVEGTYRTLVGSEFIRMDLRESSVDGEYDIIVGGPPCRPWSTINLSRRGSNHRDYDLVGRFFDHVISIGPRAFVMENVPLLEGDPEFHRQLGRATSAGYSVDYSIVRYSDYGASTGRRRLIIVGLRKGSASNLIEHLHHREEKAATVRDAIYRLRRKEKGKIPDHVWPEFRTINRYRSKYLTGKFGWRVLKWDEPAPSFGNVMKTYTLHPDSDLDAGTYRVVSVLEVSRIMGFNHGFHFPEDVGIGHRYQMLADSVSPVFSAVLASLIRDFV
jgi:DNA (cytosine-5)-methyltransferase 1